MVECVTIAVSMIANAISARVAMELVRTVMIRSALIAPVLVVQ